MMLYILFQRKMSFFVPNLLNIDGEITNISDDKINFQIFNNILGIIFLAGVDFSYNISTIDESQKVIHILYRSLI